MIHAYKNNGYNIVLDVNSGSVHVVDDVVYDLIPIVEESLKKAHGTAAAIEEDREGDEDFSQLFMEVSSMPEISSRYSSEDIGEALSEILQLRADEALYTDDVYEEYVEQFQNRETVVKALCLNIAHDCNLRCKYCFASTGDFGKGRKLMSYETGKHAIDFLLENSGDRPNLELDFFGGEPLMNFGVVKQIVEYARSREAEYNKKFRFTITTNGLLLDDEKIDFVAARILKKYHKAFEELAK